MTHCDLVISHEYIRETELTGKTVIVIDTLRATTVITTALSNGANSVQCVLEPENALKIRAEDPEALLGGERNALKIPGFDFSNSPLEYSGEAVRNRKLVMTTSNGTRTLLKAERGHTVLIGCLRNAAAAMRKALELGRDIIIVNAGTAGRFSLDDYITAGAMLEEAGNALILSDAALGARLLYQAHPDIHSALSDCLHYNRLKSLGLEKDLEFCLTPNQLHSVPVCRNGFVRLEE